MREVGEEKRARVLDPIERVSDVIFGLLMAMTFIGSLSVATAGREEIRTMMITALGCNLAWGLADAVMYLVRTLTERTRNRALLARLRGGADAATGHALVAEALPPGLAALAVRVSNFVALGMLFLSGWILARYAGGSRWRGGASMAVVGAVLMAAIMALGG